MGKNRESSEGNGPLPPRLDPGCQGPDPRDLGCRTYGCTSSLPLAPQAARPAQFQPANGEARAAPGFARKLPTALASPSGPLPPALPHPTLSLRLSPLNYLLGQCCPAEGCTLPWGFVPPTSLPGILLSASAHRGPGFSAFQHFPVGKIAVKLQMEKLSLKRLGAFPKSRVSRSAPVCGGPALTLQGARLPGPREHTPGRAHPASARPGPPFLAPDCCPVFCFCLDLPVQILKPATFSDTTHYPLLLVV